MIKLTFPLSIDALICLAVFKETVFVNIDHIHVYSTGAGVDNPKVFNTNMASSNTLLCHLL